MDIGKYARRAGEIAQHTVSVHDPDTDSILTRLLCTDTGVLVSACTADPSGNYRCPACADAVVPGTTRDGWSVFRHASGNMCTSRQRLESFDELEVLCVACMSPTGTRFHSSQYPTLCLVSGVPIELWPTNVNPAVMLVDAGRNGVDAAGRVVGGVVRPDYPELCGDCAVRAEQAAASPFGFGDHPGRLIVCIRHVCCACGDDISRHHKFSVAREGVQCLLIGPRDVVVDPAAAIAARRRQLLSAEDTTAIVATEMDVTIDNQKPPRILRLLHDWRVDWCPVTGQPRTVPVFGGIQTVVVTRAACRGCMESFRQDPWPTTMCQRIMATGESYVRCNHCHVSTPVAFVYEMQLGRNEPIEYACSACGGPCATCSGTYTMRRNLITELLECVVCRARTLYRNKQLCERCRFNWCNKAHAICYCCEFGVPELTIGWLWTPGDDASAHSYQ